MMNFEKFDALAKDYDLIPVQSEIIADLDTPVSVLSRFINDSELFLLESVEGSEKFGRYSFCGVRPRGIFTVEDNKPYLTVNGERTLLEYDQSPFFALRKLIGTPRVPEISGMPPLFGGAIGYLGYELINEFEELPDPKQPLDAPTVAMMLTDEIIVFDNLRRTVKFIVSVRPNEFPNNRAAYDCAKQKISELKEILKRPSSVTTEKSNIDAQLESNMTRNEFCAMVEKARQYIYEGEAIQLVLSQKFTAPTPATPLQLYRALRLVNPSPYTFFLKMGERTLVGSSPETMVKLENGTSSLRPIAGTRKRGKDESSDRALADELLRDEKERAEHLMLVDLGRNDLGRTAAPGSVQVKSFMTVERYSHVMHLVSDVEATISEKCDAFDLVRTTFPAGTLSGAPKIRAMELINELEPEGRGCYGGAVGYVSCNGNLDLAITIRTIDVYKGKLTIQAGAGIVYDSDPNFEYEETINKATAMFNAVKLAANGLEIED